MESTGTRHIPDSSLVTLIETATRFIMWIVTVIFVTTEWCLDLLFGCGRKCSWNLCSGFSCGWLACSGLSCRSFTCCRLPCSGWLCKCRFWSGLRCSGLHLDRLLGSQLLNDDSIRWIFLWTLTWVSTEFFIEISLPYSHSLIDLNWNVKTFMVTWQCVIEMFTLLIRFLGFTQAFSLVKKEFENLIISSLSFPIAWHGYFSSSISNLTWYESTILPHEPYAPFFGDLL